MSRYQLMNLIYSLVFTLLQVNLALAQKALGSPITSMKAHVAHDSSVTTHYDYVTWEAEFDFAFDAITASQIKGGDYFDFTIEGALRDYSPSSTVPLTYDFYVESEFGDQLFHVVAIDDNHSFRATATKFFDPTDGAIFEITGSFSVDFLLPESSPLGDTVITVGPFESTINVKTPNKMTTAVGGDKVRLWARREGIYFINEVYGLLYKDGADDPAKPSDPKFNRMQVVSGFTFVPVESHPWGLDDVYYIDDAMKRYDGDGSPLTADHAPPLNSHTNEEEFAVYLDQKKMPPKTAHTGGIYVAARGLMSGTANESCFHYTGNYRWQLDLFPCTPQGRGEYGLPNGAGRAVVSILAATTVPGPVPGTEIVDGPDGVPTARVTATPVSTNTVPGPVEGTATLADPEGYFYVQVTHTPVSTVTVPGSSVGTEVLEYPGGDFYVQITATPVSTVTVPGHKLGTATLKDPNGDFVVQVTSTPVSTNYVPGSQEGTEILTNPENEYYVQVTRTPVATVTVPGGVAGTETVKNPDGDFVVQVTATPVSTHTVPGSKLGTEVLTNSDDEFYVQVTATPVSTKTVPGRVPGTEYLTNSDGDYYEQITATPVSTVLTPGPVPGTEILTNSDGDLIVRVTGTPVSTHTVPGSLVGTEVLTNSDSDYFVQVTATPVSTVTVPGPVAGTETLTDTDGNFYEQVTEVPAASSSANYTVLDGDEIILVSSSRSPGDNETLTSSGSNRSVVSTETVPGSAAGTTTLTDSNDELIEQVTKTLVSTHIVPGPTAGTVILTNSDDELFEEDTKTVVSTRTVTGPKTGREVLISSNGDIFEQVTVVGRNGTVTSGLQDSVLPPITTTVTICITDVPEGGPFGVESPVTTECTVTSEGTVIVYVTASPETRQGDEDDLTDTVAPVDSEVNKAGGSVTSSHDSHDKGDSGDIAEGSSGSGDKATGAVSQTVSSDSDGDSSKSGDVAADSPGGGSRVGSSGPSGSSDSSGSSGSAGENSPGSGASPARQANGAPFVSAGVLLVLSFFVMAL